MIKFRPTDKVVVLTGAGISKASGIPTFRDNSEESIWKRYDPEQVCYVDNINKNKQLSWDFFKDIYSSLQDAKPNPAHYALVKLEEYLNEGNFVLVTQNVDGLHQAAGSKNVLEMHGNHKYMVCSSPRCTSVKIPANEMLDKVDYELCPKCGKLLRPSVVMFGEIPWYMDEIMKYVTECDYFISIGTSGMVAPASTFGMKAWRNGSKVINITYEEDGKDDIENSEWVILNKKAEEFLPDFIEIAIH